MTERELREALSRPVELPAEVEQRLREACAQAGGRTEKRRPRRVLRTALLAACLAAGLCLAAAAGYTIVRGEKAPDLGAALEGLFGNESRPSLQAQTEFDETGRQTLALPDQERVPLDGEQAEALLGDYLPETGYVWQVGDYTLTVESWLLDEHTGAGRVYFTLERPGGVEGLQAAPVDQVETVALELADGTRYVVRDKAAGLQNTEYALGWTDGAGKHLTLVFNRLVDPGQVQAVTVNGETWSVK